MISNLPNTTQVPNILFNGEMQKMKDTELRVTLIVTRKTLGWLEDPETGMRKEEDWISQGQLIKLTARSQKSVTAAIDVCVKNDWIEARDGDGNLLDTPEKRQQIGRGGKIFYRLGGKFFGKAQAMKGSKNYYPSQKEKGSKKSIAKIAKHNLHTTKETVLQNQPSYKTVNGNKNVENFVDNPIKRLPVLTIPQEEMLYVAKYILDTLKDEQSAKYYTLVASRVPESVIRQALSEIRADGANNPAKVFTYRMQKYATEKLLGGASSQREHDQL